MQPVEVCASLRGFATKAVLLNDFTGSVTFSAGSPDPFMSVTGYQDEHALICEQHAALVVDLPNSGVLCQMPIELRGAG